MLQIGLNLTASHILVKFSTKRALTTRKMCDGNYKFRLIKQKYSFNPYNHHNHHSYFSSTTPSRHTFLTATHIHHYHTEHSLLVKCMIKTIFLFMFDIIKQNLHTIMQLESFIYIYNPQMSHEYHNIIYVHLLFIFYIYTLSNSFS